MFLVVAMVLALWFSRHRTPRIRLLKWGVALLAVALLLPNVGAGLWRSQEHTVSFFATNQYRRFIATGDTVLTLPWGYRDSSMLWQAETQMGFRLAGGYVGALLPADYLREPILPALANPGVVPRPGDLEGFLTRHDVEAVVIDAANTERWPTTMAALGLHPLSIGGVLLYRVPPQLDTT
jgi:hypothetical protein